MIGGYINVFNRRRSVNDRVSVFSDIMYDIREKAWELKVMLGKVEKGEGAEKKGYEDASIT